MYFGTCTVYDDEIIINLYDISYINTNSECLICLDDTMIIASDGFDKTFRIKDNTNIITTCNCNGTYHNKCLTNWLNKSQSCPICRKDIFIYSPSNKYFKICKKICKNTITIFIRTINLIIYLLLWFLFLHYCITILYTIIFNK
jgi:hypothetical protein